MKPKDFSIKKNNVSHSDDGKKLMNRREALNKAGIYALSAATMMVLMKSQAKGQTASPHTMPPPNTAPTPAPGDGWQRTTRT